MSEQIVLDELKKIIEETKIECLKLEQELDRINYPEEVNEVYGDLL